MQAGLVPLFAKLAQWLAKKKCCKMEEGDISTSIAYEGPICEGAATPDWYSHACSETQWLSVATRSSETRQEAM